MVQITVNIQKRHLIIFCGIILIFLTFIVVAVVPNPGHSTKEVDWSAGIPQSVRINGKLGVETSPNSGYPAGWGGGIHAGDIYSETGVGTGSGGNLKAVMYQDGNAFFLGSVGVGTSSPTSKLEVNGIIKLTPGSGGGIQYSDNTVQTTAPSNSGRVVGGGSLIRGVCTKWGTATCSGGNVVCPTGSTKVITGYFFGIPSGEESAEARIYYLCVTN